MKISITGILFILIGVFSQSCKGKPEQSIQKSENVKYSIMTDEQKADSITFGSGCFWCTEAIFESLEGVVSAESGYMGGSTPDPTYKEICTGQTGHAEVVKIVYLPEKISVTELLEAFWASHDPTTLNRQGNDVGTQYRSVIFYYNDEQMKLALDLKKELNEKKVFENPIVTEISPATKFYIAENYHQQYFELNGQEPYCTFVIKPKLEKFRKLFSEKLKK